MCGNPCCPPLDFRREEDIFGSLYNPTNTFQTAVIGVPLNFTIAGPTNGMVADPVNDSITVNSYGLYEINFSLSNQGSGPSSVRYSIFINGVKIDISDIIFTVTGTTATIISPGSKTILITLNAGDVITVEPALQALNSSYNNPALIVKKIS